MKLLEVTKSERPDKRMVAVFSGGRRIHFGQAGGSTFIDHQDTAKRAAYIARHRVNEDWIDPQKPGTLSRFILWNKTTLRASIADYKKRFGV